jgi:hypothetical protein
MSGSTTPHLKQSDLGWGVREELTKGGKSLRLFTVNVVC